LRQTQNTRAVPMSASVPTTQHQMLQTKVALKQTERDQADGAG